MGPLDNDTQFRSIAFTGSGMGHMDVFGSYESSWPKRDLGDRCSRFSDSHFESEYVSAASGQGVAPSGAVLRRVYIARTGI